MRIALIQQHASDDTPANIRRGLDNLDSAAEQGAELAVFAELAFNRFFPQYEACLLYTSPSPRDLSTSRMPSSA